MLRKISFYDKGKDNEGNSNKKENCHVRIQLSINPL
jgi:hypothetical protein